MAQKSSSFSGNQGFPWAYAPRLLSPEQRVSSALARLMATVAYSGVPALPEMERAALLTRAPHTGNAEKYPRRVPNFNLIFS